MLNWLRLADPTQRAARKYVRAVVKFYRKYPDRPLQECIPRLAQTILRKLLPNGTYERGRLETLIGADKPCHDPVEFCCRLASFETGIMPDDRLEYLKQAETVEAELAQVGFHERSSWLEGLRASTLVGSPSAAQEDEQLSGEIIADNQSKLTIPRYPNLGNWIGFVMFASIGLVFLWFGHWLVTILLFMLGTLSLLTSITYWEFDKGTHRLCFKSGSALTNSRQHMVYPANEIVGVDLETSTDSDGEQRHLVRVIFQQGQRIVVSRAFRDANRIAAFLGVQRTVTKA
jgi:hypothetical protein